MRTSPPCAFTLSRSAPEPGTRSMSPNEVRITSGRRGNGDRLVDQLQRRDAHRAAGAVHQRDLRRQHPVDPGLDQRVRLPAADLHDRPRPRHRPFDGGQQFAGIAFVPVFIYEAHGSSP